MPTPSPTHNQQEYSVSEISGALKRVVEDNFGYVRVRGELSGFKRAASGHLYMDLKDDRSVLNAVCWKGVAARLNMTPEDGLEVICSGKLTTYGGRSSYQLVIESMEIAGEGALMALLEKRKKQLAAEGLFDPARKQELPFLPEMIGVITSPTGAVIRDILHRIADRFPVHVVVWPVAVQGEGAAQQIAEAIEGFNNLVSPRLASCSADETGSGLGRPPGLPSCPTPDLIIVARGGGSLEDLWAFNEEIVVRAAANSRIPLISAVGHETDTTLIDYAADKRAPTPTAAAEMAVPVRAELLTWVKEQDGRLYKAVQQRLAHQAERVTGLSRGLPKPDALLAQATQMLDERGERLRLSLPRLLARKRDGLEKIARGVSLHQLVRHMKEVENRASHLYQRVADLWQHRLERTDSRFTEMLQRLENATGLSLQRYGERFEKAALRLSPRTIVQRLEQTQTRLLHLEQRALSQLAMRTERAEHRLAATARMLESLNYHQVLKRGYSIVKHTGGAVVTSVHKAQGDLTLVFHDGDVQVSTRGNPPPE